MASKAAADVVDLDEVVRKWAIAMFDMTRNKEQRNIAKEHLAFTVNWSRVKFTHGEPQFTEKTKPPRPKTQVLFRTNFTNHTDLEQEYAFKTERCTSSMCEVHVERAVTTGVELNLCLKTPCEVFEANAGFKREITVTNSQGQQIEEVLTWGVDSVIKVKPGYKTTAELVVFEDEFDGHFSMTSFLSGKVLVSVTNLRDNNCFVKSIEGDVVEIVRRAAENGLRGFTVDRAMVSFVTNGHCHFRYGVEQHVTLTQERL